MPLPDKILIGHDTETFPISTGNLAPAPVCSSFAIHGGESGVCTVLEGEFQSSNFALYKADDASNFLKVYANAPYDLAVICFHDPSYFTSIFDALVKGEIADVIVREKLLMLAQSGDMSFYTDRITGRPVRIDSISLGSLVLKYFAVDITGDKKSDDTWRKHYEVLADVKLVDWHPEAVRYAIEDSDWAVKVFIEQEAERDKLIAERGIDPFKVQAFRNAVNFALYLSSIRGLPVDLEEKNRFVAWLDEELKSENMQHLIAEGILIPAQPEMPFANRARNHVEGCLGKGACACPLKMKAAQPEKTSDKRIKEYVLKLAETHPEMILRYTKPSEKFPEGQLSVDGEFLEDYSHVDPVLAELEHRESLIGFRQKDLPRMNNPNGTPSNLVHPCYDVLKRTGRTSSFSSKIYASFNVQNAPPEVRGCYVPHEGYYYVSLDHNSMELVTLAQKCYDLFGYSVARDKINAGIDLHAYLGAQIAYFTDSGFAKHCGEVGAVKPDDYYKVFIEFKKSDNEGLQEFFAHYRKLAKPTGLGYPGGLSAETLLAYAKKTFGVIMDLETAKNLKEVWKQTYPEIVDYFRYINDECVDKWHQGYDKKREKQKDLYCYDSPFGMHRAACDYCAVANGNALQTPSAEGALLGFFQVVRACFDPSLQSILLSDAKGPVCWVVAFIHDELLCEIRKDVDVHAVIKEVQRMMIESFMFVTPDVKAGTSAAMMTRWNKYAEAVFDASGQLTVWQPKPKLKDAA